MCSTDTFYSGDEEIFGLLRAKLPYQNLWYQILVEVHYQYALQKQDTAVMKYGLPERLSSAPGIDR